MGFIELVERGFHRDDVLARHSRTRASADGENHSAIATFLENVEGRFADLFGCATNADFEGIYISHQAHAITNPGFDIGNIGLLTPVEHIETDVGQMIQTRLNVCVVMIKLYPV